MKELLTWPSLGPANWMTDTFSSQLIFLWTTVRGFFFFPSNLHGLLLWWIRGFLMQIFFLINTRMEMLIWFLMVVWGVCGCLSAAAACGNEGYDGCPVAVPIAVPWAGCVAQQDQRLRQAEPHLCSRDTAPLLSLLFLANDCLKMALTGSQVILHYSLVFGGVFLVAFP